LQLIDVLDATRERADDEDPKKRRLKKNGGSNFNSTITPGNLSHEAEEERRKQDIQQLLVVSKTFVILHSSSLDGSFPFRRDEHAFGRSRRRGPFFPRLLIHHSSFSLNSGPRKMGPTRRHKHTHMTPRHAWFQTSRCIFGVLPHHSTPPSTLSLMNGGFVRSRVRSSPARPFSPPSPLFSRGTRK